MRNSTIGKKRKVEKNRESDIALEIGDIDSETPGDCKLYEEMGRGVLTIIEKYRAEMEIARKELSLEEFEAKRPQLLNFENFFKSCLAEQPDTVDNKKSKPKSTNNLKRNTNQYFYSFVNECNAYSSTQQRKKRKTPPENLEGVKPGIVGNSC